MQVVLQKLNTLKFNNSHHFTFLDQIHGLYRQILTQCIESYQNHSLFDRYNVCVKLDLQWFETGSRMQIFVLTSVRAGGLPYKLFMQ